jgi:phospho-N-acetylmuramoyl-pentapeptide-transferase
MLPEIARVLIPAGTAFGLGLLGTPILTYYLYKYKAWKKRAGKRALDGEVASEFNRLHEESEVRAPRMGGIIIWGSVALTTVLMALAGMAAPSSIFSQLNFLSRSQTWIPLATLLIGAIVGFADDLLTIREEGRGLRLRFRLLIVVLLSSCIGWWFFVKLAVVAVDVPFSTPLYVGWLIVPFFILTSLALYASGVIDGIDGLSGGVFASIFAAYTVIAFVQNQFNLATFCAVVVGGILAFLWFNVPPARFYMSDTGTMGLTLTIAVVAFMTDNLGGGIGITVLPIVGALLVVTVASNILQVVWKKIFGRKLLRIAPLHHHFEAIGWPGHKVVMRYWILSIVFASAGVILALAVL